MIGQTISHYKITAKLGEGGMGVVYKAEDTKLGRTVALKFLADHLLKDEEARRRFEREAKAAAALHHANVCPVYEIGESEGQTFLAMAFIDGETLENKIAQGPLKIPEALDVAQQLAMGLEAAHDKGIVHRDIKPGNMIVDAKGHLTIMDFGLALLTEGPKLTQLDTRLGTVAYMSPEQAQGMEVDNRTDIWALGCVLYEMVSGRRPFLGHYDQALVYSIVNEPPEPLTALRTGIPMELEFIAGKCLEKDPGSRYQQANEIAVDLRNLQDKLKSGRSTILRGQVASQTMTTPPGVTTQSPAGPLVRYRVIESLEESAESAKYLAEDRESHRSVAIRVLPQSSAEKIERAQRRTRTALLTTTAVAVLLALGFGFFLLFSPHAAPEMPLRRFALPVKGLPILEMAISPDGKHVAYTTGLAAENLELWIWDLDRLRPRRIEIASGTSSPFWSPDSDFVAFRVPFGGYNASASEIRRVSVHGGPASTICSIGPGFFGGSWSADGNSIVFSSRPDPEHPSELYVVSAQGGTAKPLIEVAEPERREQRYPQFLPTSGGSRRLLFVSQASADDSEIVSLDLDSGRQDVLTPGERPVYSPTGHIVYLKEGAIWALPFSAASLRPTGEPFPILAGAGYPSVSRDGTLVYVHLNEAGLQQLIWRDRKGQKLGTIGAPQPLILNPVLSPDGSRVVVQALENSNLDIWIHEVGRALKRRLTFNPANEDRPTWSPRGDKVSFSSNRNGNQDVFIKSADGSGEELPLLPNPKAEFGYEWSTDGSYLVGAGGGKLWYLHSREGGGYEKVTFLDTPFDAMSPDLSPDAKFLAYESNESGHYEVYVQPFPESGTKWQVSPNGGRQPRWGGDGKEIFYVQDQTTLMAVPVTAGQDFSAGNPEPLFEDQTAFQTRGQNYDVTPDGQRFVTVETIGESGSGQAIHVVENWYEEFRGREN